MMTNTRLGVYDGWQLGPFSLPPPECGPDAADEDRIDAWLNEGARPQQWAFEMVKTFGHDTEILEEALLRKPHVRDTLVEAVEWTSDLLRENFWRVKLAWLAYMADVKTPDEIERTLEWWLRAYFPDEPLDSASVEPWKELLEEDKDELLANCLQPEASLAYAVLLRVCKVRLALCSGDAAHALGEAINVGIEFGRMWTQIQYHDEVALARSINKKRSLGSIRGGDVTRERAEATDAKLRPHYQAALEEMMSKNKNVSLTKARKRVAQKFGATFGQVERVTVNPRNK